MLGLFTHSNTNPTQHTNQNSDLKKPLVPLEEVVIHKTPLTGRVQEGSSFFGNVKPVHIVGGIALVATATAGGFALYGGLAGLAWFYAGGVAIVANCNSHRISEPRILEEVY